MAGGMGYSLLGETALSHWVDEGGAQMYKTLSPGAIGIRGLSLAESLNLANETGFDGLDFSIAEAAALAEARDAGYVRALFEEAGIKYGAWGMPVRWQHPDWRDDLAALPAYAALGAEIGALRTSTWCPPSSSERAFDENFAWHWSDSRQLPRSALITGFASASNSSVRRACGRPISTISL